MAVEDIVAQHQRDRILADESAADDEGLRHAFRSRLLGVAEGQAPLAAVAEQPLEGRQIVWACVMSRMSRMPASISVESG